ncbi:MAG TPA: enolase C-terminal domain-like protein [Planctomycetota bacterium]|nr:enolase C-terminal domain-like protein [Planctomycetota bacterium]
MPAIAAVRLIGIACHEREVVLRQPFRFGVITLRRCRQLFLRARVGFGDGASVDGCAAEMLLPKWFDKDPALSEDDNVAQLRRAVAIARDGYLAVDGHHAAFALHARTSAAHLSRCAAAGLGGLVAGFGTALVDRAILDALCRRHAVSFWEAIRANLPGIDAATTPDLAGFDLDAFLAALRPAPTIAARHTVGLVDHLAETDIPPAERLDDGLPQSLEAAIAAYGCRHFKLKVRGDAEADAARLRRIAAIVDRIDQPYLATLDGNEQYHDEAGIVELWRRLGEDPALARLRDSIRFIEQPIARAAASREPVTRLAALRPVEIDESDATVESFAQARRLGYRGVSSKSCKGVYRSLLNRARCELWNRDDPARPYFMSGEDLVVQPGVALQQDLMLASLIGCAHLERNGHHYVDGFGAAPADEQEAFADACPRLYRRIAPGRARLRIADGLIDLGDLAAPGFGSAAEPSWSSMPASDYRA